MTVISKYGKIHQQLFFIYYYFTIKAAQQSTEKHTKHIKIIHNKNQAYSEYKHVLANIVRSLFVAKMPPVEARSPDCCSNVENAPVSGGPAAPASRMRRAVLGAPPVARRSPAGGARRPRSAGVRTMSSYRGMDASL